jgi:hypothetical protein
MVHDLFSTISYDVEEMDVLNLASQFDGYIYRFRISTDGSSTRSIYALRRPLC